MYDEAHSTALKNALAEIRNICPDIQTSFLFDKEGTIIAGDNESAEMPSEKTMSAMEGIFDKTETIGGLEALVINGDNGRVHISCANDMYFAIVTSKNADMTYVQTVSRVLIPTVIKLLDNIATPTAPTQLKLPSSKSSFVDLPRRFRQEEVEEATEEQTVEEANEETSQVESELEEPHKLEVPPDRELPVATTPPTDGAV